MHIMTLDCSGAYCIISVVELENNNETSFFFKRKKTTVFLASNINLLLRNFFLNNKKLFSKVKLIAVNIGPGSYTGIRASVAFAKGFAFVLKVPLFGINLMDAFHFTALMENKDATILSICNNKKNSFLYRFTNQKTTFPTKKRIKDFNMDFILKSRELYEQNNLIIIGDNANVVSKNLKKRLAKGIRIKFINRSYELSSSIVLAKIALFRKMSGLSYSPNPFYLKSSDYF